MPRQTDPLIKKIPPTETDTFPVSVKISYIHHLSSSFTAISRLYIAVCMLEHF